MWKAVRFLLLMVRGAAEQAVLRALAYLSAVAGWVLVLAAVGWGISQAMIARGERALECRWSDTLMSFDELRGRFPAQEANDEARRVEALFAEVGIDLAPKDLSDRPRPLTDAVGRLDAQMAAIGKATDNLLSRKSSGLQPFAPEVVEALAQREVPLARAVTLLTTGPEPEWEVSLDQGFEPPHPNLLGHLKAQRLLVVGAVHLASLGNHAAAEQWLEASWRLNAANLRRPDLISQLAGYSALRYQCAALRLLRTNLPAWDERLTALALREQLLTAFEVEAFLLLWHKNVDAAFGNETWFARNGMKPLYRIGAINRGEAIRQGVEVMARADIQVFDGVELFAQVYESIPEWDIFGRIAVPNLFECWTRCAKLELDVELTCMVLRARGTRRQLFEAPSRIPSEIPGLSWMVEPSGQGVRVRLEQKLPRTRVEPPLEWNIGTQSLEEGGRT